MDFKPYKIGKYLLLERLATGGMAEVYRAKASGAGGFEKQLAIKRILPSYTSNEEFQRMFEYEARLSSMLTHSNIVQIYDFIRSNDTYLLAMEYVNGKNLRQVVNKLKKIHVTMPIDCALFLITETCRGLEYAHTKRDDISGKSLNIIHRDMSPQNIMLSYEGAVKIVDFGIAKAKDRVDETRSGVIKGKFGYMSPEQANGLPIDLHSDIFSTGIILWELLTSKRLFSAETDLATLKLIQECVIPRPSLTNPKVSVELERIVMKALAKDVSQRYANAGLFYRSLQEYLNKHYPSFTGRDLGEFLQKVFAAEIEAENKRYEQLHRQSIPFSQGTGAPAQSNEEADLPEGSLTSADFESETAVTFADEEEIKKEIQQAATNPKTVPAEKESQLVSLKSISKVAGKKSQSESTEHQSKTQWERTQIEELPNREETPSSTVARTQVTEQNSLSFKQGTEVSIEAKSPAAKDLSQVTSEPLTLRPGLRGTTEEKSEVELEREERTLIDATSGTKTPEPKIEMTEVASPRESWDRREPNRQRERQTFQKAESNRSWFPAVAMIAAFGMTAYLYQLLLGGSVPTIVQEIEPSRRTTGENRAMEKSPEPASNAPAAECVVQFDSDPVGAQILINGEARGFTSTKVLVPCQRALDYELALPGHEAVTENLMVHKRELKVFKTLKRVPTGNLELIINQNVEITIDGKPAGQATANRPFVISLRAGKSHRIGFKNAIYGINAAHDFTVEEGKVTRRLIRLDEKK